MWTRADEYLYALRCDCAIMDAMRPQIEYEYISMYIFYVLIQNVAINSSSLIEFY